MKNLNYYFTYVINWTDETLKKEMENSFKLDKIKTSAYNWINNLIYRINDERILINQRLDFSGYYFTVVKLVNPKIERINQELINDKYAIKLSSKIIEVLKSYDKKPVSIGFYKRLETKLKSIDDSIYFKTNCGYSSIYFDLFIGSYDIKKRYIKGDYIKHDETYLACYYNSKDFESKMKINTFKAGEFIETINKRVIQLVEKAKNIKKQLKQLNKLAARKAKIVKEINDFNNSINPSIDDYFNFSIKSIN